MSLKHLIPSVLLFCLFIPTATADTIRVPADQPTIQAGIDAAMEGDTVLVADGTYIHEGNHDLRVHGKAIVIRSENGPAFCKIDMLAGPGLPRRGFNIRDGEGRDTVIEGFTITRGFVSAYGPGIYCYRSSPTIRNNIITENDSDARGGGICCFEGAPLITGNTISRNDIGIFCRLTDAAVEIRGNTISDNNRDSGIYGYFANMVVLDNIISGNTSSNIGGGIQLYSSDAYVAGNRFLDNWGWAGGGISGWSQCQVDLINNLFLGNACDDEGGVLFLMRSGATLENNTFATNEAQRGGAIFGDQYAEVTVKNCIFWGNSADLGKEIFMDVGSAGYLDIRHSDLEGGQDSVDVSPAAALTWGPGMIDKDPIFFNGPEGDHYLSQIEAGQPTDSPCVDTGSDPAATICFESSQGTLCMSDLTTRTDLVRDTGQVDMGYHYPSDGAVVSPLVVTGPGAGYGNPPLVRLFPATQDALHTMEFESYGAQHFGVNVAVAKLRSDGLDEILTGPGPGEIFGPHVRGFSGNGTPLPGLSFLAYGTNKYGVNVAAGDFDGDGFDEILTGAGPGAVFGPHVRAFDYDGGPTVSPISGVSFFAYGTLKWGVNVAAGDLDGDGFDEIVTGAGPGEVFGAHVRGWNVDGGTATAIPGISFFGYNTPRYGVVVSCGDVDGDGMDEIVTGPGPSPAFGARVRGWNYDGSALAELPGLDFFAWPADVVRYGARVWAGTDLDLDGRIEIIVGSGPGPDNGSTVKVFDYQNNQVTLDFTLDAYPPVYTYGVNVAAGRF